MSYYNYDYNSQYNNNQYGGNGQQQTPPPKAPKKKSGFFKVIVFAIIFGLVSGGTFYGVNLIGNRIYPVPAVEKVTEAVPNKTVEGTAVSTAVTVTDVSDIVKNTMPAIVKVTNVSIREYYGFFGQIFQQQGESAGSGFIIAEDNDYLYIATNNHVISNSSELTVGFFDDEAVSAQLQGTYQNEDVAVVKVAKSDMKATTLADVKIAVLGNSDTLLLGESTVVIGNSLGMGQTVTTGVISALQREVSIRDNDGTTYNGNLIQTDATINQGNSGGALINMNGQVVGIVNAKYSGSTVEGTGFAIPINRAKEIADELIAKGSYSGGSIASREDETFAGNGAYLGIQGMDITSSNASSYNMPQGVYISQVLSGTGAEAAGLARGDIILKLDGRNITTMESLKTLLTYYNPGDEVTLRIGRASKSYQEENVKVTLGKLEE